MSSTRPSVVAVLSALLAVLAAAGVAQAAVEDGRTATVEISVKGGGSAPRVELSNQGFDGYVFPVAGGPKLVSVPRDHHDYPAADIAAPWGAPVLAHADATVLDVFTVPESRCGLGVRLLDLSGLTYVYCHLARLEQQLEPGLELAAGEQLGSVGSTGSSTGPHLHFQLEPATAYPQEEPWFASFAGIAFRWADEPLEQQTEQTPTAAGVELAVAGRAVATVVAVATS